MRLSAHFYTDGENDKPRTEPSAYGQTGGGSPSSRKLQHFRGSAAAAVGIPRTSSPRLGGNTCLIP